MRKSDTYQAILDEGREESVQQTPLRQGCKNLGEADEATRLALLEISDLDQLSPDGRDWTGWLDPGWPVAAAHSGFAE